MEKIIHQINNKNYVLFSFSATDRYALMKIQNKIQSNHGIVQFLDFKTSFWERKKITIKVLIPEENAQFFGKIV